MNDLKIALVHDWLVSRGGAERVLYQMHQIWPQAPIYTAAYLPDKFPEFAAADIRPTWLDKLDLAKRKHQLFSIPRSVAFSQLDLSGYDIVISSASAEAKYVKTGPRTLHICYCYTPIRYYWSDYEWYRQHPPFGWLNPLAQLALPLLIGPLRQWDHRKADAVDVFVTQSRYIQGRISRYYNRPSKLIHPPVDVHRFASTTKHIGDYYLVVGRQVAYKRLDLVVDAFNQLGRPLVVAGVGEEIARQKSRAKANIEFRGFVPEAQLPQLYADAKAFIHPQEEDFGLVPVEAMAAGTPVVAYGRGGAAETVVDGKTGVLFDSQSVPALVAAIQRLDGLSLDPAALKQHARQFAPERFRRELAALVEQEWQAFKSSR